MSTPVRRPLGEIDISQNQSSPLFYPSSSVKSNRSRAQPAESSQSLRLPSSPVRQTSSGPRGSLDPMAISSDLLIPGSQLTTDQNDPKTVIWGTNVNIQEAMDMFKDFIQNFTLSIKIELSNEENDDDQEILDSDREPFYRQLMQYVF